MTSMGKAKLKWLSLIGGAVIACVTVGRYACDGVAFLLDTRYVEAAANEKEHRKILRDANNHTDDMHALTQGLYEATDKKLTHIQDILLEQAGKTNFIYRIYKGEPSPDKIR